MISEQEQAAQDLKQIETDLREALETLIEAFGWQRVADALLSLQDGGPDARA